MANEYKKYNSRGYEIIYEAGDVVLYNNTEYTCVARNQGVVPNDTSRYWRRSGSENKNFYYSDTEPLDATVGDRWVDKTTGRLYTYIEDNSGFHWVEF